MRTADPATRCRSDRVPGGRGCGYARPAPVQIAQGQETVYKSPLRGAPGQRVGAASRGLATASAPGVTIDLLAPDGHAGQTSSQAPTLYYFASAPIDHRTQLTISAPRRAVPLLETDIPPPKGLGLYALGLADLRVRPDENTLYTWSYLSLRTPGSGPMTSWPAPLCCEPSPIPRSTARSEVPERQTISK